MEEGDFVPAILGVNLEVWVTYTPPWFILVDDTKRAIEGGLFAVSVRVEPLEECFHVSTFRSHEDNAQDHTGGAEPIKSLWKVALTDKGQGHECIQS